MLDKLFGKSRRAFSSLAEREVLALAIGAEEEDGRLYRDMAERVRPNFAATATVFEEMAAEEDEHRRLLLDMYKRKFGTHIPLVRRDDVRGFVRAEPVWLIEPVNVEKLWEMSERVEGQNRRFYMAAAARSQDADIRKLLGDLAIAEAGHAEKARDLQAEVLDKSAKATEKQEADRQFVLQVVQPGLAGLMDGSVSTLAPLFAAAFATHNSHETLMVGLAAAVGAGISMGFTEGLSDDGKISGRGSPWVRGPVCGVMTAVGGLGHTLPYLLSAFGTATALALVVVAVELLAVAWIRWTYMGTGFWTAAVQVVLGGLLVVAAGMALGAS
jgi:rubrerythrin